MKKLFVILAALLAFGVASSAQTRAIGLRGNLSGVEISCQTVLGHGRNFIESDLGVAFAKGSFGIDVATAFDFVLAHPGNFNFYAGPGAMVSMVFSEGNSAFVPGLLAQIGGEYNFANVPLNISVDWRPTYIFYAGYSGIAWMEFGLGLRYRF